MKKALLILFPVVLLIFPFQAGALVVLSDTGLEQITGQAGLPLGNKTTLQGRDKAEDRSLSMPGAGHMTVANMIAQTAADNENPSVGLARHSGVSIYFATPLVIEISFDSLSWGDSDGIPGAENPGHIVLQPMK